MPRGPKHPKSPDARRTEVMHLADQLEGVGLPDEVSRPIVADMQRFAETGEGFSRTYTVPGTPIAIVCLLSNQAHITSHIRITRKP